jgi:hypothetical protein
MVIESFCSLTLEMCSKGSGDSHDSCSYSLNKPCTNSLARIRTTGFHRPNYSFYSPQSARAFRRVVLEGGPNRYGFDSPRLGDVETHR